MMEGELWAKALAAVISVMVLMMNHYSIKKGR